MNESFFSYLHRLELLTFFSGYPLVYALVVFISGHQTSASSPKARNTSLLPYAYGLVGLLYLGLQLKKLYPDYSAGHITQLMHYWFLTIWGILAIFFLVPSVARKKVISLLHSFVFFFLLIQDIFSQFINPETDKSIIRNDMKLYTFSVLINAGSFILIVLIYFLMRRLISYKRS